MKKALNDPDARATLVARLRRLAPDSTRQWGRMTPHQAVCHLNDSFRAMMGRAVVSQATTFMNRTVIRWIALTAPVKWPPGVKTRPEVDQEIGGTRPVDFDRDRLALEALIEEFVGHTSATLQPHPMFGRLSSAEYQRWGYRHVDHHLRQFGV